MTEKRQLSSTKISDDLFAIIPLNFRPCPVTSKSTFIYRNLQIQVQKYNCPLSFLITFFFREFFVSPLPSQKKFMAMNGAHLASPIRGELGYAHWPQLGTTGGSTSGLGGGQDAQQRETEGV